MAGPSIRSLVENGACTSDAGQFGNEGGVEHDRSGNH
jgi:hypothetical protein